MCLFNNMITYINNNLLKYLLMHDNLYENRIAKALSYNFKNLMTLNSKSPIGISDETEYKEFWTSNIIKRSHMNKECRIKTSKFINDLHSRFADPFYTGTHLFINYAHCNIDKEYIIFYGDIYHSITESSFNLLYDHSNTIKSKWRFRCHKNDFIKFIVWHMRRDSMKWWEINTPDLISEDTSEIISEILLRTWADPKMKNHKPINDRRIIPCTKPSLVIHVKKFASDVTCVKRKITEKQFLSFCMGKHKILGQDSPVKILCEDILFLIGSHLISQYDDKK